MGFAWRYSPAFGLIQGAKIHSDTGTGGGGTFGVVMEASVTAAPSTPIQAVVITFETNLNTTRALWSLMLEKQTQWSTDGWGGLVTAQSAIYANPKLNATAAKSSMDVSANSTT